ncbi:hypothetical protein [Arthrobacter sp. H5]|nr:hypothetical protein [Arthrobacter sp. H5]
MAIRRMILALPLCVAGAFLSACGGQPLTTSDLGSTMTSLKNIREHFGL